MCYFVVAVFLAISSVGEGRRENKCDVNPKDHIIESGSNTTMTCENYCVGGKVFWTLNNRVVDESLSTSINSSHTELKLTNFRHYFVTLQCHSVRTQQVIGGTTIRTYLKPSRISCAWHYRDTTAGGVPELFTCKWEHHMNSSKEINYTVLLASFLYPTPTEICSSNVKKCTPKTNMSFRISVLDNITVTVRAKAPSWEASSSVVLDPNHIWKMSCPTLNVTVFSDHLLVKWTRIPVTKECHCQVKYNEWVVNKTLGENEEGSVTIDKVESCANYRVSVRCRLEGALWSDWSQERTVLTKLRKGDVKLRLWRKVAEPNESGVRKVQTMWGDIPPTCQGAFTHLIEHVSYGGDAARQNYEKIICGDSVCELNVSRHAHRINLTVFHDEALLAKDSVYVPAIGESLPQVTDLQTSAHEGVIVVRWGAPVQTVNGYMIDWTQDGSQYHWRESPYTNTTLLDLLDKKPYNITVTPLWKGITGHGTQALPVCSRVGGPGNVSITGVQANDKSASVSWSIKSQEACSGAVVSYTVFYGTENGPQLNVTVNGTSQEVFLKHLKPDTQYSISVQAAARTGTTKSSDRLFKTKRFDPQLVTALSVCGTIVIVLVLSLGLCCAIQWKKFKEKPVPNPGLSSVALWPAASQQKAFSDPSESPCERVYVEEDQQSPTPTPASGRRLNLTADQEEYTEPVVILAPAKRLLDPVEAIHQSSPIDSTALLPSESSPLNPYRSQTSVKTSTPKSSKQSKRLVPVFQEKTATVYVTMDMFEQGQSR